MLTETPSPLVLVENAPVQWLRIALRKLKDVEDIDEAGNAFRCVVNVSHPASATAVKEQLNGRICAMSNMRMWVHFINKISAHVS
jgi:hypothetical protein